VERTQQTDKIEFWSLFDLKDNSLDLNNLATAWQDFFNRKRMHSSLKGKTPWQKYKELKQKIPSQQDIAGAFQDANEQVKPRNSYYLNL
jgi:hypothetical protein